MKGSKETQTEEAANNSKGNCKSKPVQVRSRAPRSICQVINDCPSTFPPVSSFPQAPPRGTASTLRLPARSPLHFYPSPRNGHGVRLPGVPVLRASTANAMFYVLPLPVLEFCFRYGEIYFRVLRGRRKSGATSCW